MFSVMGVVETVVSLSLKKDTSKIEVPMQPSDESISLRRKIQRSNTVRRRRWDLLKKHWNITDYYKK